jgi:hypothetical protein
MSRLPRLFRKRIELDSLFLKNVCKRFQFIALILNRDKNKISSVYGELGERKATSQNMYREKKKSRKRENTQQIIITICGAGGK